MSTSSCEAGEGKDDDADDADDADNPTSNSIEKEDKVGCREEKSKMSACRESFRAMRIESSSASFFLSRLSTGINHGREES